MSTTANYALRYPAPTDDVQLWLHYQHLADDVDAALLAATAGVTVDAADNSVTDGTTTSVTFTNTLTTTGIRGVAFVAPTSGKVRVSVTCGGKNSTINKYTLIDFEVRTGGTVGSGSVVRACDENTCSQVQSIAAGQVGQHSIAGRLVSGLTPGVTYNACIAYRVDANTGTINRRVITVEPVR
jgi:hypothetical protein